MPRGDHLARRLLARIDESDFELTVSYPPPRPAVIAASPGTAPQSPLTGARPTRAVFPTPPTPAQPSVSMKCLWYDATRSVNTALAGDQRVMAAVGWIAGADALAQVKVEDAALDPDDYLGKTVFTGAEIVTFHGHRYRVLSTQPVGAGHRTPTTYYVWLQGAESQ